MWHEINKQDYMIKVAGLKPIESFSDPEGTMTFGNGKPRMETVWGHLPDAPIVKCEMQREHRHQLEWDTKYFMWVNN